MKPNPEKKAEELVWENSMLPPNPEYPPYFRPVSSTFPISKEVANSCKIPFGVVISPALIADPPVSDCSETTLLRCPKCSSFITPYSEVTKGNQEWKCVFCGYRTLHLRGEIYNRPEVQSSVVDIITPKSFIRKPHLNPSFLFIFDISYSSLKSNFCTNAAKSVLASLSCLSDDTYFSLITIDNNLTIYDIQKNRRVVFSELDEVIFSLSICKLKPFRERVTKLLTEIQNMTYENAKKGHCFGNALEAASTLLSQTGGIIISFIYGSPTIGPYQIGTRSKDDLLNEPKLLRMSQTPESKFYRDISYILSENSISHYLFATSDTFIDLGVLGVPSGITGGKCKFYKNYSTEQYSKLHFDIYQVMSSKYFYDVQIRARISDGFTIKRIHANCSHKEHNAITLSSFSSNDSFAIEFDVEPHVTKNVIYIQFVVLFTNELKLRKLRVLTFPLQISDDPNKILSNIDEAVLITLLAKRSVIKMLTNGPMQAASSFVEDIKKINFSNRIEKISFGFLRSNFLARKYPNGVDGRFSHIIEMRSIGIIDLLLYMYPRLMCVNGKILNISNDIILNENVLILHTNDLIIIWGKNKEVLCDLLKCDDNFDLSLVKMNEIKSEELNNIIEKCMEISYHWLPVRGLYGDDALKPFLFEGKINNDFDFTRWLTNCK